MKKSMVKRMPDKPAKKTRRELLEGKSKSQTKLSRQGRAMNYRICHVQVIIGFTAHKEIIF